MTTVQLLIFLAVLIQVVLTLVMYLRLVRARFAAVRQGGLELRRLGYDAAAWPEKPRILANAVQSQFELPVLFYAAVLFAFALGAVNWISVILAWLFALSRIVHAMIHTGPNAIRPRLAAFVFGFAVVAVFWAYLTYRIIWGWLLLA
jgi:hypothetical protein